MSIKLKKKVNKLSADPEWKRTLENKNAETGVTTATTKVPAVSN